jgi:hypothetical protein
MRLVQSATPARLERSLYKKVLILFSNMIEPSNANMIQNKIESRVKKVVILMASVLGKL